MTPPQKRPNGITATQAAAKFGITRQRFDQLLRDGRVTPIWNGRPRLFDPDIEYPEPTFNNKKIGPKKPSAKQVAKNLGYLEMGATAELIGVHYLKLRQAVISGKFQPVWTDGTHPLFDPDDLPELVAPCEHCYHYTEDGEDCCECGQDNR